MELDTKVSSHKDIIKKSIRYQNTQLMKHCLKLVQSMSGSGLVAIEPENRNILTLSISKKTKKHDHSREVYFRSSEGSWKTSRFHR
jgi:hypothetical protein